MPAVPKSAVGYVLNRIGPYYEARGERGAGAAALREALDLRGPDPVEEHDVALRASLLINFGSGLSISLPPPGRVIVCHLAVCTTPGRMRS